MSKVIAVFGAGTGLGVAVARRFGREGFRVALIARRKERLDDLVSALAAEGIEAAAFSADLTDPSLAPGLITDIRERFGRIDVVEYGPGGSGTWFSAAADLEAATLDRLAPLYLLTPVEIAHHVLPEMTERGDGAFLVTHGYSAVEPMPHMSGPGPLMAAARNWIYSLNAELAPSGVYTGTLAIAAMIDRSETHAALTSGGMKLPEMPGGRKPEIADPDDLAEHYWDMYTKRDRVEQIHPAALAGAAA